MYDVSILVNELYSLQLIIKRHEGITKIGIVSILVNELYSLQLAWFWC